MLDIGRLNKRITFCRYVETENELGQCVQALEEVKTVWATVEPDKGKEVQEANKLGAELNYKIYTRYYSFVTADMLIRYKGKILELISPPVNNHEKNESLYMLCTEHTKKE